MSTIEQHKELRISSIRNNLPRFESNYCNDLIKEYYHFTRSYMSGEELNMKHFKLHQKHDKAKMRAPILYNLFLDYDPHICIYRLRNRHRSIRIPYHTPNECSNRKQRPCFHSRCMPMKKIYVFIVGIRKKI